MTRELPSVSKELHTGVWAVPAPPAGADPVESGAGVSALRSPSIRTDKKKELIWVYRVSPSVCSRRRKVWRCSTSLTSSCVNRTPKVHASTQRMVAARTLMGRE
jgi:hypothetical protein